MSEEIMIRRAVDRDAQTVADLWTDAAQRLKKLGTDQWHYPVRTAAIAEAITAGTCWIAENRDGRPSGTVTLDGFADPRLWTDADQRERAYYVHRLVLADDVRHRDLGSAILDWASERAEADGKTWLRLDAWTSNTALHRYYADRGFRCIRRVTTSGVVSGVLFERDAGVTLGRGPHIVSVAGQPHD